jgi:POT family proton-dependent oligopeptide transporter
MKHFSAVENKKLLAALIFIIFSIFFWAFFEKRRIVELVCGEQPQ